MQNSSSTHLLWHLQRERNGKATSPSLPTDASSDTPLPTNRICIPALGGPQSHGTDVLQHLAHFSPAGPDDCVVLHEAIPNVGDRFLNFTLVGVLGRGTFGKVFLARQPELADRLVALKITSEIRGEPQKLARLQHANIVPVYSVHRIGVLQAVCMPYFGSVTLAHVIQSLGQMPGAFPTSGRGLLSAVFDRKPDLVAGESTPPDSLHDLATIPTASPIRGMMERMNYVDAVLWIVAQIADGLAHAHERGILHRDLKPANILISDEGQPMLLDFNLAYDTHEAQKEDRMKLGGTLPYMSPELLDACAGGNQPIDERNDLFGLGVIFFELLTGRQPFGEITGPMEQVMLPMLASRLRGAPSPREFNPAVPEAVASIVRKLLEPNLECRYRSAAELHEDLERQRAHQPLRHAADPSIRERIQKWRRRNPRSTACGFISAFCLLFLVLPATAIAIRQNQIVEQRKLAEAEMEKRQRRAEAEIAARRMQAETAEAKLLAVEQGQEARTLHVLLATRSGDRALLNQGIENGRAVLSRYGVGGDPLWMTQPLFARLPWELQTRLRFDLAELLLFMARGEQLRATDSADDRQRADGLRTALRWNYLASECYPDGEVPRVLIRQRNDLLVLLPDVPEQGTEPFVQTEIVTDYDRYHEGADCAMAGRYREALNWLRPFTEEHPQHFQAWFVRALCHDRLGQFVESVAAYSICTAIQPDMLWAYLNRGAVRLQLHDYAAAEADLTKAISLPTEKIRAHLNRAIARKGKKDYSGALADLDTVLKDDASPVRALFLRADVKQISGDKEGAKRDRDEALRREPRDELSWSTRGYVRMANDPAGALNDFDAALAMNPRSREALLNKSIVLSESLNRPREAVAILDRLLEYYPDHFAARAGRGVVLARLGDCVKARQDATACLQQDRTPFLLFQMAGLFAQLSRHEKESDAKQEAMRLLAQSLRLGFTNLKLLKDDADLNPIRGELEFKRLADAAERLNPPRR